jgi:hypothetical protein
MGRATGSRLTGGWVTPELACTRSEEKHPCPYCETSLAALVVVTYFIKTEFCNVHMEVRWSGRCGKQILYLLLMVGIIITITINAKLLLLRHGLP